MTSVPPASLAKTERFDIPMSLHCSPTSRLSGEMRCRDQFPWGPTDVGFLEIHVQSCRALVPGFQIADPLGSVLHAADDFLTQGRHLVFAPIAEASIRQKELPIGFLKKRWRKQSSFVF